jgi:tripartite-type tricarboxylate transporter receptor subunit TctC
MAPIKTPRDIITKVNADTNKVLAMPEVKNRFESEGVVPKGGSTDYFDKFIRSEIVKYEQVIKKANIERQ